MWTLLTNFLRNVFADGTTKFKLSKHFSRFSAQRFGYDKARFLCISHECISNTLIFIIRYKPSNFSNLINNQNGSNLGLGYPTRYAEDYIHNSYY